MAAKPSRRHAQLTWPLTPEQVQSLDQEIAAVWRALKAAGGSTADLSNLDADNLTSGTVPDVVLLNTGVSAGVYGDATHIPEITVDIKGRVTAAAVVSASGGLSAAQIAARISLKVL